MKKKVMLIVTIITLILLATLGVSVAFFSGIRRGEKVTSIEVGDLTFKYTEVTAIGNGINLENPEPVSDSVGKQSNNVFDFKVDGKLTRSSIKYEVSVETTEDTDIDLDGIKIYITELVDGEEKEIASNFDNQGYVKTIGDYQDLVIYEETIPRNTKNYEKNFRVRMWIDEDVDIYSSSYMGKKGGFKINVNATSDGSDTAPDSVIDTDTRILRIELNDEYIFRDSSEAKVDYETSVPYNIDEADIVVVTENTQATYTIEKIGINQLGTKESLVVGDNYFRATVTSSNGNETETYNLKVSRSNLADDEITLAAKVAEYTGNPIEANQATALSGGTITYKYYNGTTCEGEELSGAPTNVGNYSVKAISSGSSSYHPGNICVTHTIIANTNNYLASLSVNGYNLNQAFNKNTLTYTVTTEAGNIEIEAQAEGPGATVTGTGEKTLTWGSSQVFTITVTSQSGAEKAYTITVNNQRPEAPILEGGSDDWTSSSKTISIATQGTALSGVKEYEYYKTTSSALPTDETEKTGIGTSVTVADEGITYVYFRTVSNNNNKSEWTNAQLVKKDSYAPTNLVITSSDSKLSNTWHTAEFTINFSATKNGTSDIKYYYGTTNNPTTLGNSVGVTENTSGTTYYVKACNSANVCTSNETYIVKLDSGIPLAPTVTGGSTTWTKSKTYIITSPESTSGISGYEYYVSNVVEAPLNTVTATGSLVSATFTVTTDGQYIFFRVINNAGTKGEWTSANNLYVDTNTYTISYTLNDGSVSPLNPTTYDVETATITLNNPTKTGYTFSGWTGSNGETAQTTVTITTGSRGNKTYTANFVASAYTITYNLNGGTNPVDAVASYTIETNTFNLPTPTKEGYTFDGWYTNSELTGNAVTQIAKGSIGDKEYWAKWTPVNYSITYNLNGGTQGANPVTSYTAETNTFNLPTPTKEGYTFGGWYTNSELTGDAVTQVVKGTTGNKEYWAKWTAKTTVVTLDQQDGSGGTSEVTATYNSAMPSITIPTRAGYTFSGYYTEKNGAGTQYYTSEGASAGTWNITDATKTLYAKWTATSYTVAYNLNGGTQGSSPVTSYTIETNTFDLPIPTKDGYTFGGWFINSGLTGDAVTQVAKGSTGNKEYWAKWTPTSYTISYDLNGGSVATANPASYTVESSAITLTNPTKTGYTFKGWSGTGLVGDSNTSVTIAAGSTGNRSYTANWTATSYSITYNLNEGTNPSGVVNNYTIETNTFSLPTPTRSGYEFDGWYTNSELTGNAVTQIAQGSTGNKEYWAKWIQSSYTVTLNKQGGSGGTSSVSVQAGQAMPTITVPTRANYVFQGYSDKTINDATAVRYYNSDGTSAHNWDLDSDTTLYAIWFEVSRIKILGNDATVSMSSSYIPKGTSVTFTVTPAANHYLYEYKCGNFSVSVVTGLSATSAQQVTVTNNTYDYSEITCRFTAVPNDICFNGGTVHATGQQLGGTWNANYDSSGNIYTCSYSYDGSNRSCKKTDWCTSTYISDLQANCNSRFPSSKSEFAANLPSTISCPTSTVTFDKQSGANGTSSVTATYGKDMPSATAPTRTGYAFGGYYTETGGTGTQYYNSDMSSAKKWDKTTTTILYAKWTPKSYSITYNLNNGTNPSGAPANYTIETDTFSLPIPTRTGYDFGGWYTSSGLTGDAVTQVVKGTTGNKEYWAKWTAKRTTITLDRQSATSGSTSVTATYGYSMPNITKPSRTGYTFGGYYTGTEGTGTQYYTDSGASARSWDIADSTMILYAKWTPNTYTITFDVNGGNALPTESSTMTVTYDQPYGTMPTPTRNSTTTVAYAFDGWYTASSGGNLISESDIVNITTNKKYYAHWVSSTRYYTVTFDKNGGDSVSPASAQVTYNGSLSSLATASRANYVLDGWWTDATNGTQVTTSTTFTANTTIFAHWAKLTSALLDYTNSGQTTCTTVECAINELYN